MNKVVTYPSVTRFQYLRENSVMQDGDVIYLINVTVKNEGTNQIKSV